MLSGGDYRYLAVLARWRLGEMGRKGEWVVAVAVAVLLLLVVMVVVVVAGLGMRNACTTFRMRREGCVSLMSDTASIDARVSRGGGIS